MLILRKIKDYILKKPVLFSHLAVVLFLAGIIFIINPFPRGSVVAQGDFYQLINIKENFRNYLFTWFYHSGQGQFNPLTVAFPFYFFQMILENLGLAYSQIAGILAFGFLYGAFLSFYFSLRWVGKIFDDKKIFGQGMKFFGGLIYALNIFTFNVLSFSYGYLHHFLIYLFIPPLMALFLNCLLKRKKKNFFLLSIVFFFSTIGFNNVAFLAALFLFEGLIFLLFFLWKKLDKRIALSFLIIVLLQLIISIYFLAPFISSQLEYSGKIETTESFGGDVLSNIRARSNSLLEVFSADTQKYHFPGFNYYQDNFLGASLPQILGFLPVFVIFFSFYFWRRFKKTKNDEQIVMVFLIVFLLGVVLMARISDPFEKISELIFQIPGFLLFRSPDKIQVFFQYFLTLSLVLAISFSSLGKRSRVAILILLLLAPFPFYIGGVNRYLNLKLDKTLLEYDDDGYKISVMIPNEYREVATIIDEKDRDTAIVSLPYAKINSLNWANYPKWNFVGHDFLYLLYGKRYIGANSYDHPVLETRLSFREVNERGREPMDLLAETKKFGAEYIMFHKDISDDWFSKTEKSRSFLDNLNNSGRIRKIEENNYFILYQLSPEEILPVIGSNNEVVFEKINPTKYRVSVKGIKDKTNLDFLQSFNSRWKIYLDPLKGKSCSPKNNYSSLPSGECPSHDYFFEGEEMGYAFRKSDFEVSHSMIFDFANRWELDPEFIKNNFPKEYYRENPDGSLDIDLTIYFLPQSYFYLGLIIDFVIVFVSLIFLNIYFLRRKN